MIFTDERENFRRLVQLLVLNCAAFAAPILNILSSGPEFFVNRRASAVEICTLVLILLFAVPLVLWLFGLVLSRCSERLSKIYHHTALSFLAFFLAIPLLELLLEMPSGILLALAAGLGAIVGVVTFCYSLARTAILIFVPILVLAPLELVRNPSVQSLLFPDHAGSASASSLGSVSNNVVVVVFDEFSLNAILKEDATIDEVRYPHFADLARQSTWYRNASSVNQFTPLAVPALLSGLFPKKQNKLPTTDQYPVNLFTLLGKSHAIRALEPFTKLCPEEYCKTTLKRASFKSQVVAMLMDVAAIYLSYSVPEGMNLGNPDIDGKWGDFWNEMNADWDAPNFSREQRFQQYRDFIGKIKRGPRPTLFFMHMILPHMPYQFTNHGVLYPPGKIRAYANDQWVDEPAMRVSAYQQFLTQVGAADDLLGRLIARLKDQGLWDDALLVVAADHGVSFEPKTYRRGHPKQPSFYQDVMSVPLFFKLPGQKDAAVSDRNVEITDVLPSIVDALHGKIEVTFDGASVFSSQERPEKHLLIGRIPHKNPAGKSQGDWGDDLSGTVATFPVPIRYPLETIKWKYALPGFTAPNPANLYYIGPHPELLGTPVASLQREPSSALSYSLYVPNLKGETVSLKPRSGTCPCLFQGALVGSGAKPDLVVAIVVNGVIGALAKTFQLPDRPGVGFSTLLSDSSFKEGQNKVEFFELRESLESKISVGVIPPGV